MQLNNSSQSISVREDPISKHQADVRNESEKNGENPLLSLVKGGKATTSTLIQHHLEKMGQTQLSNSDLVNVADSRFQDMEVNLFN